MLDEQSGTLHSQDPSTRFGSNGVGLFGNRTPSANYGDTGGASRFFYCAKASRSEREAGLEGWEQKRCGMMEDDAYPIRTGSGNLRDTRRANGHPTVKPVALMRWLVRLVTPPDGLVLDPFTGSGTTGIAATLEGRRFLGIEREAEYVEIARARIAHAQPALGVA
jgi:site-specific DNA-methyltransferase (adenine-specific)